NFARPNEHIQLASSPFYVNDRLRDWNVADGETRRAAISSFGFSGTNAHIVIAEHAPSAPVGPKPSVLTQDHKFMVPLSAKTPAQLRQKAEGLLKFVRHREGRVELMELAYTLQVGRDQMAERVGFLARTPEELISKLEAYVADKKDIDDVYAN